MRKVMLKSKIHRARVTEADLNYEGSITIDKNLLEAADIVPYERVAVWNVTNGHRFETYAMEAPPASGTVCLNGAAARLVSVGDIVIIATFGILSQGAVRAHKPKIIHVDENNRIVIAETGSRVVARVLRTVK
jgi:aspartate 1-decarboxylase